MSSLTDRICGEHIQPWTKRDVVHDESERVFYSLAEVEYIAATAAAMTREACIAAVREVWARKKAFYGDRPFDAEVIAALREVQPSSPL